MVSVGSSACASVAGTSKDHTPPVTVVVYVSPFNTTVTVWPSSAPVVVPLIVTSLSSSRALMISSLDTTSMVIVGAVSSCSISLVACVAGFPARSLTSAVIVSVASKDCASTAGISSDHTPPVTVVVYVCPFKVTVTV